MIQIIKSKEIYTGDKILHGKAIIIENGIIAGFQDESDVGASISGERIVTDMSGCVLVPGFIDSHTHGANGFDTMDGSYEAINEISKFKIKEGVTTFCAATTTMSENYIRSAVQNVRAAMQKGVDGAKIAGVFLEGPYITEKYKGAHDEKFIREINIDEIKSLAEEGCIKSFAIAPDKPNAMEAVEMLAGMGINVRLGHTDASYEIMREAVGRVLASGGTATAIHAYNAMSPFTHRQPGAAGAVLLHDGLYAEIICDFIHTHPAAVTMLHRLKGTDKTILITDSMMASGLSDGVYMLGGVQVTVKDTAARTPAGNLAGSTLLMNIAVKNICSLGIPLFDAVIMASVNPAKTVGIYNKTGSLEKGKAADIVAIDDNFNVKCVIVDGEIKL